MAMAEKIIMAICAFSGFLWLRHRARGAQLESQMGRSLIGVFVLLPGILIGEDYLFAHVHFGAYTDLLLKVLAAGAAFPLIGYACIRTHPETALPESDDSGQS
jgi:hypothetical protein